MNTYLLAVAAVLALAALAIFVAPIVRGRGVERSASRTAIETAMIAGVWFVAANDRPDHRPAALAALVVLLAVWLGLIITAQYSRGNSD